jgi:hypothetical protein
VPYRGLTALLLLVVLVRVLTWGRCKPKNAATSGRRRTSETASTKRLRRMGGENDRTLNSREKRQISLIYQAPFGKLTIDSGLIASSSSNSHPADEFVVEAATGATAEGARGYRAGPPAG